MHRTERLNLILRLLLDQTGTTVKNLCNKLSVSERSLYRDLDLLKSQGYPIEGSVGRGGGIRLHPSYGLGKVQLSTEQSIGVLLSVAVCEKMGIPFFSDQLKPARQKIVSAFADSQRKIVRRLQERVFVGNPASASVADSYRPPKFKVMKAVESAFLREQKVSIEYTDEKGVKTIRTTEPHGIFINFPAWYLITFDELRMKPRLFRIDRVSQAQILNFKFHPKAEDFFEKLVGRKFGNSI